MHYFNLKNGLVIAFDFELGETAKISYKEKSITVGRVPIFSVKMRDKSGASRVISSTACTFSSNDGETVKYTSIFFDAEIFIVCCDGQLLLRANLTNKTDDLFEWIELCPILVGKKLKNEGGEGEIVYPYNEGCLVRDMAYRESMPFKYVEPDYPSKNKYSIFPSMVFAQFIAYGANGHGLYLGMHDQGRTTKHIDFCYYGDGIKVFARTFCDVGYGENYQMPFDTVLAPYFDDWRSAADIYYDWFSENLPNGLVKISQNEKLPNWYAESPLVVAYPIRGKHDTCVKANGFYPYENVLPMLDEISQKTDSKIMALLMHWEGTAPWAPPYYWPPYGGEEEFNRFVQKAHNKDMLVGLYCSGMGWTQQSNIVEEYNQEQAFKDLGIEKNVCTNTKGEIKSTICTAQRRGFDLCPATGGTKELLIQEYNKICASNIDYLQALDQNHGGCSCFCYSDNHGHIPAPGKWQHVETNKMLESINKNGVLFGCETAASEPFLKELNFSDNRFELNYYLGEAVPIYSYIFHEYVNNFMGNQICSMLEKKENCFTYRLAYSFLAGDMLTIVIGENGIVLHSWCDYTKPLGKNVERELVLKFISTLNGWRKGAGKDFLHYGKMIKPIKIVCPQETFLLEDGKTYLTVDAVISSAYSFNGEKAQFLVNYNLYPVEITLEKECDVYLDSNLKTYKKGVKSTPIAPLTAIMIKI